MTNKKRRKVKKGELQDEVCVEPQQQGMKSERNSGAAVFINLSVV